MEDYTKLYDDLKSWIDTKTDQSKTADLPSSVEALKKEIDALGKVKSKEMPSKKKDMAALSEMQNQLEAQNKNRPSNPGVPSGKEFQKLQEVL